MLRNKDILKVYFMMIIMYVVGLQIKAQQHVFIQMISGGSYILLNSLCFNQHANTILCLVSYFDISFGEQ